MSQDRIAELERELSEQKMWAKRNSDEWKRQVLELEAEVASLNKTHEGVTAGYLNRIGELKAENLRLSEQLKKAHACEWCGSNDLVCGKAWKDERDGIKAEQAKLREQLGKYGRHDIDCRDNDSSKCTCGFADCLTSLSKG